MRAGGTSSSKALVMSKLTSYLPNPITFTKDCENLRNLSLADSDASSKRHIVLIIGADYFSSMLRDGLIKGPTSCLTAQLIFG